jgi:fatty acid desaturase
MDGLFIKVLFPYFFAMFVIIPYFFISLNYIFNFEICISNVLCNLFLAEISTNIHSFIIIGPNHSGDDLYRFDTHVTPKSGEFYLRQIISSSNYTAGNDFIDFLQGWLNYQIEHHLFPDLSMLQYRYAMPMVKKVCLKHSIPYVQENVFIRLAKTIDIMTGKTSMKKFINKS